VKNLNGHIRRHYRLRGHASRIPNNPTRRKTQKTTGDTVSVDESPTQLHEYPA
jgi:hypothetical protein